MTPEHLTPLRTVDLPITRIPRSFHALPSSGSGMPLWAQFATAIQLFYRNCVTFRGRATRAEFWWVMLFHVLVIAEIVAVTHLATGTNTAYPQAVSAWQALNTVPLLSLTARRFHDTDSSAALLLTWLVPVAGPVVTLIYALTPANPRGARFDGPSA